MEYKVPDHRSNGHVEGLNNRNMVFNWPISPPSPTRDLNQAMWQMSIQPTDSCTGPEISSGLYPERPGVADCAYYQRTGSCGFGMNCRFNHPQNRKEVAPTGEPTQKAGQVECQFYLKGTCKFGTMCKFEHSNQKEECGGQTQFNFLGLPIRRGEKECSYYIRTGSCKYGVTCRFHHPEPASEATTISVSNSPVHVTAINSLPSSSETSYSTVHPSRSLPRAPYDSNIHPQEHGTYMHAMTPMPAWSNNYQSSVNPLSSLEGKHYPMDISLMNTQTNGPSANSAQAISALGSRPFGVQPMVTVMEREGSLERPGHPECPHYLKNGYCTLGAFCRFHHPKRTEQSGPRNSLSSETKQFPVGIDFGNNITQLNDLARNTQGSVFLTPKPVSSATMALPSIQSQVPVPQKRTFPQRRGHSECQYYMKTGDCKFGEACRYHHPKEKLQQSSACMLNPTSLPMHYVQNPFLMPEENQHNTGISIVNSTRQPTNLTSRDVSSVHISTESTYSASIQVPPVQSQDFATQRETFPERPGQPECQYYMKTGNCKFGAACRFHHPKENSEKLRAYNLSGMGLPSHPVSVSKSI